MAMRGRHSAVYGELVDQHGQGSNVEVLPVGGVTGLAPERFDVVVERLVTNAEQGSQLIGQYTPIIAELMQRVEHELKVLLEDIAPSVAVGPGGKPAKDVADRFQSFFALADQATQMLERLYKMTKFSIEANDDAVRLRAFIATGSEEKGRLEACGETQLRRIVMEAARGFEEEGGE